MKTVTVVIAMTLSLVIPLAEAQQTSPTLAGAESEAHLEAATPPMEFDTMPTKQGLEQLQRQLDKLSASKDPAERRQLMQEFRQQMGGMMAKMGGARRGMMMGEMPMRERSDDLQARLQDMMDTEDPEEQAELLTEQHRQMHGMMGMMQHMHGGGRGMMMDSGKMERRRGMMQAHRGLQQEWMMAAHRQMEKRLDMIQTLLEQVLREH